MIGRIHKYKQGGLDYMLFNEDLSSPLELHLDGSLAKHWHMSRPHSIETLQQLSKGFYNGKALVRNAGSNLRNEGWIITFVADPMIQAMYAAADCEDKRKQLENDFLAEARRFPAMIEEDGARLRNGRKPEVITLSKLERTTRDGRQLLHIHTYLFNVGHNSQTRTFGALSLRRGYKLQKYYQTVMTKGFANRLMTNLHFDVYRRRDNSIGIRGITAEWLNARLSNASTRLNTFKSKVGLRKQKVIERFNRFTRTVKQQWDLKERLATWRSKGVALGWYLKDLQTRSIRFITDEQQKRLSVRYTKRAIRWESNRVNLVSQKTLIASTCIEAFRDARVTEDSIKEAIEKIKLNPKKYGLESWKYEGSEYLVLLRNGQLITKAISKTALMAGTKSKRHKVAEKELAHLKCFIHNGTHGVVS